MLKTVKAFAKQLAVQIGVQSVFVAADQLVRTIVKEKVRPHVAQDNKTLNK